MTDNTLKDTEANIKTGKVEDKAVNFNLIVNEADNSALNPIVNKGYIKEWEPTIIAFLCNWCSYAGADLAGTGRLQYPPNIRIIRVPCSGRLNPLFIIKALLDGADGVMVSGCHPGDCHYLSGNMYARRRFAVLKKLIITAGISPDRVHFTWVSASEGSRFAEVVDEVTNRVKN